MNALEIPYLPTGSVVSSIQGEPRASHDIEVIVEMQESDAGRIQSIFPPPGYYLDPEDARDSIRRATKPFDASRKLRWARRCGGSEKQFGDALRVFEVQRPRLDISYLDGWVQALDLTKLWQRLVSEAEDA